MPTDSRFKRLAIRPRPMVQVWVEGQSVQAREGDSAAALMLALGLIPTRSSALSAQPRAPYCMMGVCFECLMDIDGVANVQACMTPVRDGMRIERQWGRRDLVLKPCMASPAGSAKPQHSGNDTAVEHSL